MENASKAQKLRTTLGVFERSKFFFNLPGSIIESVQEGRYEVALRDYKKGRFLLESRPGQLLPVGSSLKGNEGGGIAGNDEPSVQQRRILDKVWAGVDKAMGELRSVLQDKLRDPTRSTEDQEKTIE